jgi:hypothetical protein
MSIQEPPEQEQQQDPEVTLIVKASWLNAIMAGLDEIPHRYSRIVFDSINQQAEAQLKPKAPTGVLASKFIDPR